jgi:hypothetical protein
VYIREIQGRSRHNDPDDTKRKFRPKCTYLKRKDTFKQIDKNVDLNNTTYNIN